MTMIFHLIGNGNVQSERRFAADSNIVVRESMESMYCISMYE